MSFFNSLLSYRYNAVCENCGEKIVLKVPRGTYVYEFLKDDKCKCYNCGCRIRRILTDDNKGADPLDLERIHQRELYKLKEEVKKQYGVRIGGVE